MSVFVHILTTTQYNPGRLNLRLFCSFVVDIVTVIRCKPNILKFRYYDLSYGTCKYY